MGRGDVQRVSSALGKGGYGGSSGGYGSSGGKGGYGDSSYSQGQMYEDPYRSSMQPNVSRSFLQPDVSQSPLSYPRDYMRPDSAQGVYSAPYRSSLPERSYQSYNPRQQLHESSYVSPYRSSLSSYEPDYRSRYSDRFNLYSEPAWSEPYGYNRGGSRSRLDNLSAGRNPYGYQQSNQWLPGNPPSGYDDQSGGDAVPGGGWNPGNQAPPIQGEPPVIPGIFDNWTTYNRQYPGGHFVGNQWYPGNRPIVDPNDLGGNPSQEEGLSPPVTQPPVPGVTPPISPPSIWDEGFGVEDFDLTGFNIPGSENILGDDYVAPPVAPPLPPVDPVDPEGYEFPVYDEPDVGVSLPPAPPPVAPPAAPQIDLTLEDLFGPGGNPLGVGGGGFGSPYIPPAEPVTPEPNPYFDANVEAHEDLEIEGGGPGGGGKGGMATGGLVRSLYPVRGYEAGGIVKAYSEKMDRDSANDDRMIDVYDNVRSILESGVDISDPRVSSIVDAFIEIFGEEVLFSLVEDSKESVADSDFPEMDAEVTGVPAEGMSYGGMVSGPGTGTSDSIPAVIDGQEQVMLSNGEYVIPADAVNSLGNGSSESGAMKLMSMVDNIRSASGGRAA